MIHELRIYRCAPGKLPDLNKRFDTITLKIWERFDIRPVGFWTVLIGDGNHDLYYLLEWKDLAERERVWNEFVVDPEWVKARSETERNGPIVANITNFMLSPTSYSKMR